MNPSRTILYVEDDLEDQALLSQIFTEKDATLIIEKAHNGIEALSLLDAMKQVDKLPALIILDIQMPRMDGMEMLRFIKGDEALKEVPVVIFTTSADGAPISKEEGIEIITKPYSPKEYDGVIDHLLQLCK